MAFTDLSRPSSRRFFLVRLSPARAVTSLLSLDAGVYKYSFGSYIYRVTRNGVDLNEVSGTPSTNDDWYYDADGGELQVKLASAPDEDTNVIVAHYRIYYTTERARALPDDPIAAESSSNPLQDWEPRLTGGLSLKASAKNLIKGVLTTTQSSVSIIDNDSDFQQYLTSNDSFANKDIDIWLGIDSVDNADKVFNGIITDISYRRNTMSLGIRDKFSVLNKPAYLGDTRAESVNDLDSNATLDPAKDGSPIFAFFGSASRFKHAASADTSYSGERFPRVPTLVEGACIDYDNTLSTSNNRKYRLGKSLNALAAPAPTVSSITAGGAGSNYIHLVHSPLTTSKFQIGMAVTVNGKYYRVIDIPATNEVVLTWNSGDASPSVSDAITGESITLYFEGVDGAVAFIDASYSVTITQTNTSNNNTIFDVTLPNNIEASFAGIFAGSPLDPSAHKVKAILNFASDVQGHGVTTRKILQKAGAIGSSFSSTFATADTDLDADVRFSIPEYDEVTHSDYRKYIERITQGAVSVLYQNKGDIEYKVLSTPNPSATDTIDNSLIMVDSLSATIDYVDIAHQIVVTNPHSDRSGSSDTSNTSRYLHDVYNVDTVQIGIEPDEARVAEMAAIRQNRRVTYKLDTATNNLDSVIGDSVKLESPKVLGLGGSVDTAILSIDKSNDIVTIEIDDLLGV